MIAYLIKGIVCSAVLWLFHYLFLEREKLHTFNRFYLLLAPLVAFIVPFIPLNKAIQVLPVVASLTTIADGVPQGALAQATKNPDLSTETLILAVLWGVYLLGVTIRFVRAAWGMRVLKKMAGIHQQYPTGSGIVVGLPNHPDICTFMQYVFCDKDAYEKGLIPHQVLRHEFAHVRQKHSWDIIYMELLGALYWFNPMIILYRRSIVLNHEFLADQEVNKIYSNISTYQTLLIDRLTAGTWEMASGFNYSQTKKRLIMMTQHKNWTRIIFKGLALSLVTIGMIYIATDEAIAQNSAETAKLPPPPPFVINVNGSGINESEMSDYVTSFEKHRKLKTDANGKQVPEYSFTDEEKDRLWGLAERMTSAQQNELKHQLLKIPPAPKNPLSKLELDNYKGLADHDYHLDGRKVEKETLDNLRPEDISVHWVNRPSGGHDFRPTVQFITNEAYNKRDQERMKIKYTIRENPEGHR